MALGLSGSLHWDLHNHGRTVESFHCHSSDYDQIWEGQGEEHACILIQNFSGMFGSDRALKDPVPVNLPCGLLLFNITLIISIPSILSLSSVTQIIIFHMDERITFFYELIYF